MASMSPGTRGDALAEQPHAFIDQREQAAPANLLVRDGAALDTEAPCFRDDHRLDLRVGHALPRTVRIQISAAAGFLPEPPGLDQKIGHPIVARVVRQILALAAHAVAHIQPGQIAHRIRTHRHAEALESGVDLRRARTLQEQQLILASVGIQHAVADEAEAIAHHDAELTHAPRDTACSRDHVADSCRGRERSRPVA